MEQSIVVYDDDQTRAWVTGWIEEKAGRTNSVKTRASYTAIMESFREFLWVHHLTLGSSPALVATAAQAWAAQPRLRKDRPHKTIRPVGNAAHNQRIAILSSFYRYLIKRFPEMDLVNPIDRVSRRPIQENVSARALAEQHVTDSLAKIDRSTPEGLRDYALLLLALSTGRRASELASLCWADIERLGNRQVVVRFRRCKGGKQMSDLLDESVAEAIFAWLARYYPDFPNLPPDAPLWMNLSRSQSRSIKDKKGLTVRGISHICLQRLGTGKVHTTRHTFAHLMEDSGAKISDISARLGHENPNITGRYMVAMHSEENPFAASIVGRLTKKAKEG